MRGFRPITDAPEVYGSIEHRATAQAAASATAEAPADGNGFCAQRRETRLARAVARIPAGASWSYITGVEPDFVVTGVR